MDKLHILRPNKLDSAWLLIEHYIDRTVEKEIDPHEGIHTIIWSVYHNMDWYHETKEYVGDAIGIQELDGLCDSFDDLAAASKPWSTIKTNTQLLEELKEEIVAAAERYKINYLAQRGAAVDRQKAGSH